MSGAIRSMPELIAGLRDCVHERGVAFQTVDAIAGLPDRYTSKVLGPTPIKNIGAVSLEGILGAVGKALVLVDDPDQMKRVEGRWTPRQRPLKPSAQACRSSNESQVSEAPILQPQNRNSEYMKMIGKRGGIKGGKRRAKMLGKRARQRIATHAARKRWSKGASK